MAYQSMTDKGKKMVDKERMPGGKTVKRKDMPAQDPLAVGKRNAIEERTKSKTKQTEDKVYKAKMRKDNK